MEDLMELPDGILERLEEVYHEEEDAQNFMHQCRISRLTNNEIIEKLQKLIDENEDEY